jgi:hypothetical protein
MPFTIEINSNNDGETMWWNLDRRKGKVQRARGQKGQRVRESSEQQ